MTPLTAKQLRHFAKHGTNVSTSKQVAAQLIECEKTLQEQRKLVTAAVMNETQLRADFDQYVAITEELLS